MKKQKLDAGDYLKDILNAVDEIQSFTADMTYDEFIKDKRTLNAVTRSIEIIGEASKNIPDLIKAEYPALPGKQMAGMRNKLVHAYFGIDTETLWEASKNNIPSLKVPIEKIIKEKFSSN
jgi:uncharacterized protein with HEPN domain